MRRGMSNPLADCVRLFVLDLRKRGAPDRMQEVLAGPHCGLEAEGVSNNMFKATPVSDQKGGLEREKS